MITPYIYELWNGKEVVGHYVCSHRLQGTHRIFVEGPSELKKVYGKVYKEFAVPISYRIVYNNGVDILYRSVLDVRKKSKRQIDVIKTYRGMF